MTVPDRFAIRWDMARGCYRGCPANYCRRPSAVELVKGAVRLALCHVHARDYRELGYVDSPAPDEERHA